MVRSRLQEHPIPETTPAVLIRHLTIRGSNVEIGRVVAQVATAQQHVTLEQLVSDARLVRARRRTFERGYPIHARRMQGVAAAFGLRPDDDRFDFSLLATSPGICGLPLHDAFATYSPPWTTDCGHGILRWTGSLPPEAYVMEWLPGGGTHPSLALHGLDLLSGTVLGVNDAGLVACAVADHRVPSPSCCGPSGANATLARAVGLHELALLRLVLDTCATVDDAQAALLGAPAFRMFGSVRYLIADRTGRSFTYEATNDGSVQRIVEGGAEPMELAVGADPMPDPQRPRSGGGSSITGQTRGTARQGTRAAPEARRGPRRHDPAAHTAVPFDQHWDCLLDQDRRDLEVRVAGDGPTSGACIVAAALPRL